MKVPTKLAILMICVESSIDMSNSPLSFMDLNKDVEKSKTPEIPVS
jgi:hypothetical protein